MNWSPGRRQTNASKSLVKAVIIGLLGPPMTRIYCKQHRFPAAVIQHAV